MRNTRLNMCHARFNIVCAFWHRRNRYTSLHNPSTSPFISSDLFRYISSQKTCFFVIIFFDTCTHVLIIHPSYPTQFSSHLFRYISSENTCFFVIIFFWHMHICANDTSFIHDPIFLISLRHLFRYICSEKTCFFVIIFFWHLHICTHDTSFICDLIFFTYLRHLFRYISFEKKRFFFIISFDTCTYA